MKLTNNLGLPHAIVKAVENDPYDNQGTRSVTTLLKPPQAYAIIQQRGGELTEDAADRIWALTGQIGHLILERAAALLDDRHISERRYYAQVGDHTVSGQVDLIEIHNKTVYDFKFTSAWSAVDAQKGDGKSDWRLQLSMLAFLAREGKFRRPDDGEWSFSSVDITTGKIVAILRDWTERASQRNRDWEDKPIAVIDMNILSHEETRAWIEHRNREFDEALAGNARPCTDEERWLRPGKWAVYKGTNQKAAKLEDTEEDLSSWIFANRAKLGANYRIEQRPSEYKRCEKYCAAAAFCPQYQATKGPDEEE